MRILILFGVFVLVLAFIACGDSKPPPGAGGTVCPATHVGTTANNICLPKIGCGPDCQINRPDGAYVFLETGITDPVAREKIAARVIAGLEQTIRSAQHHNPSWQRYNTTGHYNVWMINKHALTEAGWPALMVGGIKTAGTVINTWSDGSDRGPVYIILAEPERFDDETYWAYLQAATRHEGEHVIEYANAIGVFLSKIGEGDIHPHWSLPDGSRGLVASKPVACAPVGMEGPVYVKR